MKFMVAHRIGEQDVLFVKSKSKDITKITSGTGTLDSTTLTGDDFSEVLAGDDVQIKLLDPRVGHSAVVVSVESTTSLTIDTIFDEEQHDVKKFRIRRIDAPADFSVGQKAALVIDVEEETGYDDVEVLCYETDNQIGPMGWFIDTADGNKLKRVEDQAISPV